ncbi:MAG: PsiF family protein [Zoogloeaceae bacterium]|jgi:hypothetical protein|nr:PsiF family protein [Zoogloeaceae bacterium]
MNHKIALVAASLFVLFAAPAALASAQQERMKACNAEAKAKNLTGPDRRVFMKDCLSAKRTEAGVAKTAQQEKMKTCNAEAKAKNLTGSERKKFMSECLRG